MTLTPHPTFCQRKRIPNALDVQLSMAVEAKDSYEVMLLPGDGIGPEITAATVAALEPLQSRFKINFKEVRVRTNTRALLKGRHDSVPHPGGKWADRPKARRCLGGEALLAVVHALFIPRVLRSRRSRVCHGKTPPLHSSKRECID